MLVTFSAIILTGLIMANTAAQEASRLDLSWDGPMQNGTRVRVHNMFTQEGLPGPPGQVTWGNQSLTAHEPSRSRTLLALFGDAESLDACARTAAQGPVSRDGLDGFFTANLGPFATNETVTVFLFWDDPGSADLYKIPNVHLGAGREVPQAVAETGGPGQPGPVMIIEDH